MTPTPIFSYLSPHKLVTALGNDMYPDRKTVLVNESLIQMYHEFNSQYPSFNKINSMQLLKPDGSFSPAYVKMLNGILCVYEGVEPPDPTV